VTYQVMTPNEDVRTAGVLTYKASVADLRDGIIEQVCNILEGGKTAFGDRRRKYQLSDKVQDL